MIGEEQQKQQTTTQPDDQLVAQTSNSGLPTILVVNLHMAEVQQPEQNPLIERIVQRSDPANIIKEQTKNNVQWRIHSKYFQADLQWVSVNLSDKDIIKGESAHDEFIESLPSHGVDKVEAIVYYATANSIKQILGISQTMDFISKLQESFSVEMSTLFYDGPSVSFDKKTDKVIEEITTSHFIEYISEDLAQTARQQGSLKMFTAVGQSLLDGEDEATGIDRIYEALQTCMWSNMQKVNIGNIQPINPIAQAVLSQANKEENVIKEIFVQGEQNKNNEKKQEESKTGEINKEAQIKTAETSDNKSKEETPQLNVNALLGMASNDFEEDSEEDKCGDIMNVMQQIKDARENGQNLNDDDRKKNAEDIMKKLAKMMDLGEGFDGEDYGDEEI